jgi:trans-aconitate 2-methyltransferase
MPDQWDAKQYLRFADQRLRPFLDLVGRAEAVGFRAQAPRWVADLGCGPGNATALLAERWPGAYVLGVDSSPAMIEDAAGRRIPGRLEFELGDLRDWRPGPDAQGPAEPHAAGAAEQPGPVVAGRPDLVRALPAQPDLILANAVLQWVPGQLDVLGRLAGLLAAGGTLGMQVPGNFDSPSHTILADLVGSARWRDLIPADTKRPGSYDPAVYLETLEAAGLEPDVWETTYLYLVDGETGVADFVSGTALRPITTRLSPADAAEFTAAYQALVREAYPPRLIGGRVGQVLPYRRIFAVGRKG